MKTLLLQIPGVFDDFIPAEGARMIGVMEARMGAVALALAALLVIVAVVIDQGRVWMAHIPPSLAAAPRLLLVVLLFVGHYEYHYYIYAIPAAIADELIISEADMEALNDDFIKASQMGRDGQPVDPAQVNRLSFPARLGLAVSLLNPVSYIMQETAMNMVMTVYFFSVPFMHYLWISLVSVEFVFGKLVIVFGVLPVWGPRALVSYFGAIVSLGLWQVWNAFCAFMVKNADAFFHSRSAVDLVLNGSLTDVSNHYAMIPIALVHTALSLMGLTFIYLIFGFSKFTMGGGFAMQHATNSVINSGASMITMPVSAYLGAQKHGLIGGGGTGGGGAPPVAAVSTGAASAMSGGAQYGGGGSGGSGGGSYTTGQWMTSGATKQIGGATKQIGGGKT